MKKTLITGQDGSYLAEFLPSKGYGVHGIKRRSSSYIFSRIDHVSQDPHQADTSFFIHRGDMTDASNVLAFMADVCPDEAYNLAAQTVLWRRPAIFWANCRVGGAAGSAVVEQSSLPCDMTQYARSALCHAAQWGLVEVIWSGFHVLPDGRTAHTISRLRVGGAREVLARGVTEKDQA